MNRPTKEQYKIALNGIEGIKNVICNHRKNIDKHLDYVLEIKKSINELEDVLKRNEEIIFRYEFYEKKEGVFDD